MRLNLLILHFIFFILSFAQTFAQDTWTQKANFPGEARWGAISFSINGKTYVGMGYDGVTNYGDLWEYDPLTNTWNQKAGYPITRRAASAFVINGKGYVCCGINSSGLLNDVIEYDPSTNVWTAKANLPSSERYGASGFCIGNKGYICCGNLGMASGPYTNELWEYEPQSNSWSQKASFIGNVRFGITNTVFVIDSKAYTGMGVSGSNLFNDMYSYNQPTNSWTQIANYPGSGRAYLAGFSVCNYGYLGTGQASGTAYSDFWRYDPVNNNWTQMNDFGGNNRWLMVASESNEKVFVGTGDNFTNSTNDWWEYSCTGVGFRDIETPNYITISPNPVTTQMNIQLSSDLKDATLNIYDSNGRIVRTINNVIGNNLILNRSDLSEGLYFIQILQMNEVSFSGKFIINYE